MHNQVDTMGGLNIQVENAVKDEVQQLQSLSEWQHIVDFITRISNVKVGLIMHVVNDCIEVLVSSHTKDNPYKVGDKDVLDGSGLYCEAVIKSQKTLIVTNALKSKVWNHNPDLKFNLIAYMGVPIKNPEGRPFGTLCLLNDKATGFPEDLQELMVNMVSLIEGNLKLENANADATTDISDRIEMENKLINVNEQFELAIKGSNDGIWDWNTRTNALYTSPKWKEQLGYQEFELSNEYNTFARLLHPEDKQMVFSQIDNFVNNRQTTYDLEFRMKHKSGKYKWIRAKGAALRDETGKAIRIAGSHTDVTEQRKAEDALKKSEAMYRILAETISDVIWVLNIDTKRFVYISPSIFQLRGYTVEEALNQDIEETMTAESLEAVLNSSHMTKKVFIENPENPVVHTYEVRQPCKDGRHIWVEISSRYRYNSENGIEIVGISRNIDERKKAEEEILYLSYHDQLTGLFNRRYYEEELKRLDTLRNYPLTLVMADLNDMKLANDTYGHAVGDEILICFATILKEELREDDIVARIGGDEFVILLPKADCEMATSLVSRIQEKMSHTVINGITISAAFGCHTKTAKIETLDAIFRSAENQMYSNKKALKDIRRSESI